MNPASRTRDIALVALVPLFFSTNVVIGRAVTAEVAPWTLAFLRWSGALLILLPFAVPALRENRDALVAQGGLIATLAFLGMWICGGLVYTALETTTATNATLIYTSANVMILILEWLFRGRPIGPRELIGTALAFTGVAIVALGAEGFAGVSMNSGDLLIGIGALSWSIYSVLLKRPGLSALPGLPLFAAIMLMGALMLLPMMLWEAWRGPALPRSPAGWLAVAGVALIPSVGAFSGYQYGIRRFGPGAMAMISYLATPYGILLAVVLLGETFAVHHAVGLALILPGVILATAGRNLGLPRKERSL
ncbi:MAG: EamA family transporter [Rhizobiales bacterium]|nr:EamA family transporter [Hyphomicrobiales bacterium]